MARNRIDECMFCERIPCQCGRPARPDKSSRAGSTKTDRPTRSPSRNDAEPSRPPVKIPRAATATDYRPVVAARTIPVVRQVISEDDLELRRALTVLAEIISAEDLEANRHMIDLPSWKVDALIWKQSK